MKIMHAFDFCFVCIKYLLIIIIYYFWLGSYQEEIEIVWSRRKLLWTWYLDSKRHIFWINFCKIINLKGILLHKEDHWLTHTPTATSHVNLISSMHVIFDCLYFMSRFKFPGIRSVRSSNKFLMKSFRIC